MKDGRGMEQTVQMEAAVLRGFLTERARSEWNHGFFNTTGKGTREEWKDGRGIVKANPQGWGAVP